MQHSTVAAYVKDTVRASANRFVNRTLAIDTHLKDSEDMLHLYASLPPKC
jgi:hypothetical protein